MLIRLTFSLEGDSKSKRESEPASEREKERELVKLASETDVGQSNHIRFKVGGGLGTCCFYLERYHAASDRSQTAIAGLLKCAS